ncbi:MAG: hypothetical protein IT463_00990 [Planctomycetes bacterium]|nr:hypothetical protein [Planctomycetota bacterium]
MHDILRTRQEDDPHGLAALNDLLATGTDDNFEERVRDLLPEITRVRALFNRVRRFTPDIEFSPYVMRVLKIADKWESARLAEVA